MNSELQAVWDQISAEMDEDMRVLDALDDQAHAFAFRAHAHAERVAKMHAEALRPKPSSDRMAVGE